MIDGSAQITLRILATTDLHACIMAWDYYAHKPADGRGLSRVATLIEAARAETLNSLLLDNGDFLSGSGLGDLMAAQFPAPSVHPMVAAMNHLGFDAVNLGNHEFSHGLPFLRHSLKDACFSLVCSNFQFQDMVCVQKSLLLTRKVVDETGHEHDLRIGILGLLPSQTMVWEAANLGGSAKSFPMLETAQSGAKELRSAGADMVIALAHTGLAIKDVLKSEEHLAEAIAQISDIDAVIAGHSHQAFASSAGSNANAMVQPGFFGSHLGVLDLTLRPVDGRWTVRSHHAELRPIARRSACGRLSPLICDAAPINALAMASHNQIIAQATAVIGHTDQRLHSYFATITSCTALALIAKAQASSLSDVLAQTHHSDLPVVSAVAPFRTGERGGPENYVDLPAGPLLHHHASDLYIHPNRLVGFRVTGAQLALRLERSVSKYNQITPQSKDAVLWNPDYPSFNFDIIFGLTYEVDLAHPPMFSPLGALINPAARRVVNLRYRGQPVRDQQMFALASNSYRRDGNAGFAGTSNDNVNAQSDATIQSILRSYMSQGNPTVKFEPRHWHFTPQAGASVLFATSPAALEVVEDIALYRPEPLGLAEAGFLRFRLHL